MDINLKYDDEKSTYIKQICYLTGLEPNELLNMFLDDNFFNQDENVFLKFKKLETPEIIFLKFKKGLKEIGLKLLDVASYFDVTNSTITKAFNGQKNIVYKKILSNYELVLKEVFLDKYKKEGLAFLGNNESGYKPIEIAFIGFASVNNINYSSYSKLDKSDKQMLSIALRSAVTAENITDDKYGFLHVYNIFNNSLTLL